MAAAANAPSPGRLASVYSEVQTSRIHHALPLPSVLCSHSSLVDGPPSSATGNPDEIAKLFPNLFGQPSAALVPAKEAAEGKPLKVGVVLSGGQAPGGHNVICGIFDFLQDRAKGSTMYGFKGGPAGVMKCKYVELNTDFVYPYRNQGGFDMICSGRDKIETPEQFKQAEDTANKLELDGLVVIGGDDSNTNACLIAEYFRSKNLKTRVIGCPKTIDGDLKCKEVPTSFGFDTACKIYSEMIGNVMTDARSSGKYYHFVRLMGRAASHITLECALQTHPNIALIGEEVAAKKQTLKNVTDYITDIICKRTELGYNYGVILIPEGLIDFIPEVQKLIAELNEILAHDTIDEAGVWKNKLEPESKKLFEFLPPSIQEQLLLERDPHGNVQVAKIETEKMLIDMVETELGKRKSEGKYKGNFIGQSHFFGYEGRCGLPTNFDASYCYALGYGAGALLQSGKTGLISSVGNLAAPVAEWTVGGTALTSLMDVERRHGKFKPVIKKAMVELDGAPFKKFASLRDEWALKNRYISPGPIQFIGSGSDAVNHTLLLELGVQA
uniref:Pyrophosphate--fructose 6-phosphate 1-phosphotransferase subunit beta n=1 Tax=Arundo donax TaxID=35708 RepID=A0A0A8Y9P4_ARUDO